MDGQILSNSLLSLKGTDLRMVYSLLLKTNIGHLLSSKTKDLLSKENNDHFTHHLEKEVEKLGNVSDEILQVDLFLEMTKLLKLRGTNYTFPREIDEQCSVMVNMVHDQLQKQDKHFRIFSEKETSLSKLQQIVQYQMRKVFSELDNSFQDFSIDEQTRFASQVNTYIQSLPIEKQQVIMEKLGIDHFTDEMIRKTIAASGTSVVFAILVEVSGFAFYTTATSLIATFAGLFGLTLPFGIYTGLTSTIAVLANPLFMIPLLLGGGVLLVNHQNKAFKIKLLPIIIMQMALPYMSSGEGEVSFDLFIEEWDRRFKDYQVLHSELKKVEAEQLVVRKKINESETKLKNYHSILSNEMELLKREKDKIFSALKSINLKEMDINPSFSLHRKQYLEISGHIQTLNQSKKIRLHGDHFLKKIGDKISSLTTTRDIREEEKKLKELLYLMVEDVLSSNVVFKQAERENIQIWQQKIDHLSIKIDKENETKKTLEARLKTLNQNYSNFVQAKKKLEKENHGFGDLNV